MNNITCPNCGNMVTPNNGRTKGFCGNCGTPVELTETLNAGSVPAPAKVKKKRGFLIPIAIVVAVAAVLGVGGYFALPALAGNSYQKAETAFLTALIAQSGEKPSGSQLNFTADYAASAFIADNLELADTSIEGTVAQLAGKGFTNLAVSSEGVNLGVEGTYDGNSLIIAAPDITSYYHRYAVNSTDDGEATGLDTTALKKTVTNFAAEYFKLTEGAAEVEKGVELTGGNVSVKCDKYTIEFTYGMVNILARVLIDEARDNDDLLRLIEQYSGYSDAGAQLDHLEDMLDRVPLDEDARLFRMTVWVKNNQVVAREIDKVLGATGAKLTAQFLQNNKAAYVNFSAATGTHIVPDQIKLTISGDFEKTGGAWDGSLKGKLTYEGYYPTELNATVKVTAFKTTDKKYNGNITATVSGTFDGDSFDKITVDCALAAVGNKQSVTLAAKQGSRYDFGELELTYSVDKINALDMPEYDEDYALQEDSFFGSRKDDAGWYDPATGKYEYHETPEERAYREQREAMENDIYQRNEAANLDAWREVAYDNIIIAAILQMIGAY